MWRVAWEKMTTVDEGGGSTSATRTWRGHGDDSHISASPPRATMVSENSPVVISLLSEDEGAESSSEEESQDESQHGAVGASMRIAGAAGHHRNAEQEPSGEGAAAQQAAPELLRHSLFAFGGLAEAEESPSVGATPSEPDECFGGTEHPPAFSSRHDSVGGDQGLSSSSFSSQHEQLQERSGGMDGEEQAYWGEGIQQTDSYPAQRDQASNDTSDEASPVAEDPLFRTDKVLSSIEMELAWLGEESKHSLVTKTFQFAFVWEYASEGLRIELRKVVRDESVADSEHWYHEVLRDDWLVRKRFEIVREKIRNYLRRGHRREVMAPIIAEIRLRQRKLSQADRTFPPIDRTVWQRHVSVTHVDAPPAPAVFEGHVEPNCELPSGSD